MEDSVRTTSSGTSLYLLSTTSVANAHGVQISRPHLKGYKTKGLCICANSQGWLLLCSCRRGLPVDRQDLVTFSHMAQNVPYCLFTPGYDSHGSNHFWGQKEVDDVFVFQILGCVEGLSIHHLASRFSREQRRCLLGCGGFEHSALQRGRAHFSCSLIVLRDRLLYAGTAVVPNCREDPPAGPDSLEQSAILASLPPSLGLSLRRPWKFPLNFHSRT